MPVIFPFGEGKTEKIIFDFLKEKKCFPESQFRKFVSVGGKRRFKEKIPDTVKGDVSAGKDEVRILAFRDLDSEEKVDGVVESFRANIVPLLVEHPDFSCPEPEELQDMPIYKWEIPAIPGSDFAGLRFVLHIANHRDTDDPVVFRNQTSDGYIFKLALLEPVLERFANDRKVKKTSGALSKLVIDKIPAVIREEEIDCDECKDYLSAYLTATRFWAAKCTEEEALLVNVILERAWKHDNAHFKQVFRSWLIAIEEVVK